ncbi:armadillo repeat-containing protein 6 isoform X2 [Mangifera indica]|uniref:armadillo repeat-containing protein 6 isoform X2 n=1 Tax=Mangifera indica TaxID=29780 RepID=UPI001CFBD528|nr:armadillo repeat-containing protein 6 isoform X2 [Mangifera indica]
MGPANTGRVISQEAFDEVVKENMEDLGMEPVEALEDAIQTLTLQGVDLSGIVKCVPGECSVKDNPVIQSLERLKQLNSKDRINSEDLNEMGELFDKLIELCGCNNEVSGNVPIATRNGAVELVCAICSKIPAGSKRLLLSCLKMMALFIHDIQSSETFRVNGGPKMVVDILRNGSEDSEILNSCFAIVTASATGNEVVKESFMELKIDELVLEVLSRQRNDRIQNLYYAMRVLLTADDDRVVASQVYGYARRFAKIGIAKALTVSLAEGLASPNVVATSSVMKAIAVNDEICTSIAECGGVDALLRCIDESGEQGNKAVARTSCSLLSKLAGSDSNKSSIIEKGGMERLVKLSARFSDDPSVLQEVMSIITVLSLRSPDNAARAIEAGAGDLAIQVMQKFPKAQQLQRNSCFMIRNLVVRNPENRTLLLNNGIEKLIRQAKENHESCKDAATDALRDLGLDDYNK